MHTGFIPHQKYISILSLYHLVETKAEWSKYKWSQSGYIYYRQCSDSTEFTIKTSVSFNGIWY